MDDLYEHAPCGYLSMLPDGTIVKVNGTFLAWTGYERHAVLGNKTFQSLWTVPYRIFYETHFAPLLRMQGVLDEIAVDLHKSDGSVLPVLVNARQTSDEDGEPVFLRATVFNASERRRYERELLAARARAEKAVHAKAEFIATLGHEVRNPLSAITSAAALLTRSELSEQQRRYVDVLSSSTEALLGLVNHILEYSAVESEGVRLSERVVDPRVVVSQVTDTLAVKAEERGIDLVVENDDGVPGAVWLDPLRLRQVLLNLVGNAVKFTERGSVGVALSEMSRDEETVTLRFSVTDTGIGIPPARLERIFDEFSQGDPDVLERFGGTGLGLSISKKLVALYGSHIVVESEVGRGSTFRFDLRLRLPKSPDGDQS